MKGHARQLDRNEYIYASTNNGISGVVWKDKKLVSTLSTAYPASTTSHIIQRDQSGQLQQRSAPLCIKQYRKYMNGVDRFASMLSRYECDFRTVKWWVRVMWYMFDMSIANSYIISTY